MPTTYSVDTSALLDGWVRSYPPSNFPKLWDHVDQLIDEGRLLASEEVFEEIKEHDDALKGWVTERPTLVVSTDQGIATAVREILVAHDRLVMSGSGRNRADPFVIAVAKLRGATVLTGEKGGTVAKPKIPSVCSVLQVPCIGFLGLIQAEGWVFA